MQNQAPETGFFNIRREAYKTAPIGVAKSVSFDRVMLWRAATVAALCTSPSTDYPARAVV